MSMHPHRRPAARGVVAVTALAILLTLPACSRDSDGELTAEDLQGASEIDASYATRGELFAALRASSAPGPAADPSWTALTTALSQLKTLDAASVDPETSQLVLIGESSAGPGAIHLEDVAIALKAAFFEPEAVGMTIDENPDDKTGPLMFVKFFGGTRDTHFGQVMFECDRLMKSLGLGQDNVTKAPLTVRAAGFATQAELSRAFDPSDAGKDAAWSRFWLTPITARFPESDLRGKPLVELSQDAHTISFVQHDVFVDTEEMVDTGKGERLSSSGGRQSPSAQEFANRFTALYDQIAVEYPAFAELKELAKLVTLAEWIRNKKVPIDPELLFLSLGTTTTTPKETPTLATETAWTTGNTTRTIKMFGGVTLTPKPRFVSVNDAKDRKADAFASTINTNREAIRSGRPVSFQGPDQLPRQVTLVSPPIRGPTHATEPAPVRVIESTGALTASRRRTSSLQDMTDLAGGFELGVYRDSVTKAELMDLPVMRIVDDVRTKETARFTIGGETHEVVVPASLSLTSPSRSINIGFSRDPLFDSERRLPYFKSKSREEIRYYPDNRTVSHANGTEYQFDVDGLLGEVRASGGLRLGFEHNAFADGQLYQAVREPGAPRGPPVRVVEATGRPRATAEPESAVSPVMKMTVTNLESGLSAQVWSDAGRYVFAIR